MIIKVTDNNIEQAAFIHSLTWKASHKDFCSEEFVAKHSVERQKEYIQSKLKTGSNFYLLVKNEPVGIVSINGNLIEDLYVLPEHQNKGYGTELLLFAIKNCNGTPTLWILENNVRAKNLYVKNGFKETGNVKHDKINEMEYALQK